MADTKTLTPSGFDRLLRWLDAEPDEAAEKYEQLRARLIRIFNGRGCFEAEHLADLTFDRVATKLDHIQANYDGEPVAYFHGVARNIYHEWRRKEGKLEHGFEPETAAAKLPEADDREHEYACLEECLAELNARSREMIVEYYRHERRARIENRQRLANELGITRDALHVRANRIRVGLLECVTKCAAAK